MASASRPHCASAFPSNFHAAEYTGSFSTAALRCATAAWKSASLRYPVPREKRSNAPSLAVPTSFRRFAICCEGIGYYNRSLHSSPSLKMARSIVSTPNAPAAIGTYSQAVRDGDTLYLSGQIGLDPGSGKLVDGIENQIERVFKNLEAVAEAAGASLADVVKLTVYLTDLANFASVNQTMSRHF